jgi:single-stranded DNA-binding protein
VDPFIITTAGWLRDEPFVTTTSDGQPMVELRLAVGTPPRAPGGPSAARCCKVVASGALASRVAEQLHEGEHVIVRARDLTTEAWVTDEGQPRSTAVLQADAITPSLTPGPADDGPLRPGAHPGRHPGRRPADNRSEAQ